MLSEEDVGAEVAAEEVSHCFGPHCAGTCEIASVGAEVARVKGGGERFVRLPTELGGRRKGVGCISYYEET